MRTIIVATDFSCSAVNAINYAAELAAQTNARLYLFHAFHLSIHASNTLITAKGINEMLELAQQQLDVLAKQKRQHLNIQAEAIVKPVSLTEGLEDLVKNLNADLVVMGMHENDWGDRLFGNTTLSIMRDAGYPVLIVPEKTSFKKIERILYAYAPHYKANESKLQLLKSLSQKLGASVQLLHVEPYAEPAIVERAAVLDMGVESALENIKHNYKDVYQKDVVEGIEKGLAEYNAELLVAVPHKLELWKQLTKNSVTRRLAIEVKIPLLILPIGTMGSN